MAAFLVLLGGALVVAGWVVFLVGFGVQRYRGARSGSVLMVLGGIIALVPFLVRVFGGPPW